MYFFTADEHYGHKNAIKYSQRPFDTVEEMDEEIISRFNEVVSKGDITIHAGDFTLAKRDIAESYIRRLNGKHIFLRGSHDRWLNRNSPYIWERTINKQPIVVCHYAMRTWHRSHYNSWQLYGHSHGTLEPIGKQWDIGIDNNNYYPLSFEDIEMIMNRRPDNPNLVYRRSE